VNGRTLRWMMSFAHRAGSRNGGGGRLTIVRHHRVYGDDERPLSRLGVRESVFRAQLALLGRQGLVPVTVQEGLARLDAGTPGHWVAMSFDDGYADNVHRALPALRAAGARASFYLAAGLIEERRAPWWDALAHVLETTTQRSLTGAFAGRAWDLPLDGPAARARAMAALTPMLRAAPDEQSARLASLAARLEVREPAPCALARWDEARALVAAGMEVGAHTLGHPLLSRLDPESQRREIQGSAELIRERLGVHCAGFAYPGGDYDSASVAACRSTGFAYAVTTRAGDVHGESPRFELPRRGLSEGACLGPGGRFSERLARAELDGAFDRLRRSVAGEVAS